MSVIPLPRDVWPRLKSERATRAIMLAIYALVVLVTVAEIARSLGRQHRVIFEGYIQLGEAVLTGSDPYTLPLNTWPPFFMLVSVPLALVTRWSATLALLLWQIGGALAIWGSCRLAAGLVRPDPDQITFWPRDSDRLAFASAAVIVPFLMTARLFQEHLQHTQINAQVLFLVLLAFHGFRRRRIALGGLSLAAAASIKAMPIVFVPYLAYKRAWRELGWTAIWLLVLNAVVPAAVFGPSRALDHWRDWRAVADREVRDPTPHFMNQSLLAGVKRLTTEAGSARDPIHYTVVDWPARTTRLVFYAIAGLTALGLAWRFRRHPRDWSDPRTVAELAICIGAMTVVDPLAWKAHYVTLIVPYAFAWTALRGRSPGWRWVLWWGSCACLTLSAPALIGNHARDVLESLNVILLGALLLLVLSVWLLADLDRRTRTDAPGSP